MSTPPSTKRDRKHSSAPTTARFSSDRITIGAGVAIFHLASQRVVVCYHSRDEYWFLPKGRRNASEETGRAAEREGFEESGYRNRLLPLPIKHRQPAPETTTDTTNHAFDTEPLWTQLMPVQRTSQYILHWYAAETLPEDDEEALTTTTTTTAASMASATIAGSDQVALAPYSAPPVFPKGLTLRQRIEQDTRLSRDGQRTVYEPRKHEGTGVDEEELLYESHLLTVGEARKALGGSVMAEVVREAWELVQLRIEIEDEVESPARGNVGQV